MTQGVCYFLCGGPPKCKWKRYVSMIVVSLHSLRQWYDGRVCVLIDRDIFKAVHDSGCLQFAMGNDSIWYDTIGLTPVPRHAAYVTKSSLWRHSPYDQTVLLDADTIVTGDIGELFFPSIGVTKFAAWNTQGKIVGGRLHQWNEIEGCSCLVKRATDDIWPALNTGVVSWHRDCVFLRHWEKLTQKGWPCSFTDELAMQLLLPDMFQFDENGMPKSSRGYINDSRQVITAKDNEPRLFSDRYNCSPSFGVNRDDARIWHYHGRRMVPGRGKLDCAAMYRPHLLSALEANAGGIRDWLKETDPALWDLAQ